MHFDVVILGAGPAGLGAGYELNNSARKGRTGAGISWRIFEASNRVGGLSSSRVDKKGFTWDLGGHVIYSMDDFFNSVVENAIGEESLTHKRAAFVRMKNRFIPFPLQNNIHRLPKRVMEECLRGMIEASGSNEQPRNFEEWIKARFGPGLARHFMLPYNRKAWDYPLEKMDYGWFEGRVSLPDIGSIKRALKTGRDVTTWGPNATFIFPLRGGTGTLFKKIAAPFKENIFFRHEVVRVDTAKRRVFFKNGVSVRYQTLVTTLPLDRLIRKIILNPPREISDAAGRLRKNSGWMVGIGIKRKIRTERCWVYFPEENTPFYRITYFSNYSPFNVPDPESYSSILCEISVGTSMRIKSGEVVKETVNSLIKSGIIREDDKKRIATAWRERLPYAYPIPTLGRDDALKIIENYLNSRGIFSVGRFGGWRYEKGNMDHSFLAGVEAVRLVTGG